MLHHSNAFSKAIFLTKTNVMLVHLLVLLYYFLRVRNYSAVTAGHSLPAQPDEGTEFDSLQRFQTEQKRLRECKKPQGDLPLQVYTQFVPVITSQRTLYFNLNCNF